MSEVPRRIQLARRKGWRMPPNTVKVDRTTKWGNPFVPGKPAPFGPTKGAVVADRRHAFVLYRSLAPLSAPLVAAARAEPPAADKPAKRKYTRKAKALAVVFDTTDGASVADVAADSFSTSTLKLTADQARELAVITLSHPRPLSERMRKTVIDLVRIAA